MNNESQAAKDRLDAARRAKDRYSRLASTLTVAAVTVLAVLLVALLDYWLMLPVKLRWAALIGIVTAITLGIYRLVYLWRRPSRLKDAALDLENHRPEIGCEVSTAAEYLSGERNPTHEYEPELVSALESRAASNLKSHAVPYRRRVVRPLAIAGFVTLGLVVFALAAPYALKALMRTALPWANTQYTEVEVTPGNIEIPVGHDFSVTNRFTGRSPRLAELRWREAGQTQWASAPLNRAADGTYIHTFKQVQTSFAYQVIGGDATSLEYQVTTYIPPEVKALRIHLDHPEYTGLEPLEQQSPEITAIRATEARFRITPNVPLKEARLRFSSGPILDLKAAENNEWSGTLRVTKTNEYWIELVDHQGHRGGNENPHHITALPDLPPKVEIPEPGADLRADSTNTIPIQVVASDDFGVGEIKIVYHRLGEAEQSLIAKRRGETNGEVTAEIELALSDLQLKQYEVLAYHAEVRDNNTLDGPGIGKSQTYFVEITNEECGVCKKQPQQNRKVNLLVIQKQIIADTGALPKNASPDKYKELAARQKDAIEFGRMYQDALSQNGAPMAAQGELNAAVKDMEKAVAALDKNVQKEALPPEETSLGHLYQVLKLMPQLQNFPTTRQQLSQQQPQEQSNELKVVLEAIKKLKKDDLNNEELAEALEKAKEIARTQAQLNASAQNGEKKPEAPDINRPEKSTDASKDSEKDAGQQAKASPKDGEKSGDQTKNDSKNQEQQAGEQSGQQAKRNGNPQQGQNESQNEGQSGQQAQSESKAQAPAQGQGQGQAQPQAQAQAQGKGQTQGQGQARAQAPKQGQGQGKGLRPGERSQQEGEAQEGKEGELAQQEPKDGQGQRPGEANKGRKPGEQNESGEGQKADEKQLAQLAPKQQELSKEAKELAERLERLAGKDARLGHNVPGKLNEASEKMANAAKLMQRGNGLAARSAGDQGSAAVNSAVAILERILQGRPDLADVSAEEAPAEFETAIADYFKRLSHAE